MSRHQARKVMNRDPVCGKRVNRNKAHIAIEYRGREYLLCCPLCQAEFERNPEKHLR
ncbi:MAG: YHS domain-containing protein [Gammaproteobacteria bacterium]|nr:YHS domain-containing protein [Acidobacteriota bacterium]NIP64387.1 YHS domain-containing protein [Gammaproteobacteria bacterium]NIQ26793.1 YHS domain-containing protein [Gammaproteobacteria bacterium]NIR19847.1 YHS domain-containing protein [Gammaproteobacteria bacterium]NIT09969.1 YHS domain-containing protein [Acidobacteriota bacterium]